ncbi:DUF983 domain-containing protein [Fulvivirga sedimenti]|uniref:DUF983 domain-containing protein n=1 Tax=Fulvivirga sedimenti TaxID=2879465 RepID=A0A9X1KWV1_9BACT|nr:DUF983 domain-containing protein [Fulvivirga sedimenti]MCA6073622.1 DUF983 domain-containing protein [Fulvivirga sedimenti]
MPENSKGAAILSGKCPRCREGDMFKYPLVNVFKATSMHENCPVCGLRYEVEPGFFFGAMYISYAFSVALFTTIAVALSVLGDFPVYVYAISIVVAVVVLFPLMFRYSRILFLHLFGGIKYQPGKFNKP